MATLDQIFTHHPPHGSQVARYEAVRAAGKAFAVVDTESAPQSRELSLALTAVQQAVMWVNAAIAINESTQA